MNAYTYRGRHRATSRRCSGLPTVRLYCDQRGQLQPSDRALASAVTQRMRGQFPPGMRAHPTRFWPGTVAIVAAFLCGFWAVDAMAVPEPAFAGVVDTRLVDAPVSKCVTPDTEQLDARAVVKRKRGRS